MKNNNPENLFLESKTGRYSYADLHVFSDFFAKKMENFGPQPVGICSASSDAMVFIFASCWIQNMPFVPFNPSLPEQKIQQQINRLQPGVMITDEPGALAHQSCLDIREFDPKKIINSTGNKVSTGHNPLELTAKKSDIFGYFFTSGTSGTPKIVPLKRRQLISAARGSAINLRPSANECWLLCMPLFHVGGITVILRSLLYGSGIYRLSGFDTDVAAQQLSSNKKIVAASLVPTMLKRLLDQENFMTPEQFQAILLGGGPVHPVLIEESFRRDIPIITSYGMTETCAQIAANPLFSPPEDDKILQSAGQIFAPNKVEIRNLSSEKIKGDNSGIIWLKGPQIFDGYLENPDINRDEDGWFNTGDYGNIDAEGRLYIEARRTDLIITGGENVSPREVETELRKINSVDEAAVFGRPDEEWGQRVVAAVVTPKGIKPDASSLKNTLKKTLPAFKIPKQFIFVNQLPRTHNGKLQRSKLAELIR
ncbi:MAG TPA: AMP-binding protein [Balneolaceae bacterium]|nr:AMP-binding protein [Balneolaceae bacterium]